MFINWPFSVGLGKQLAYYDIVYLVVMMFTAI